MGFLRRLFAAQPEDREGDAGDAVASEGPELTADEIERAHELELARFEQERTTDLVRRQQQYSDRSWVPPAQGGTARSGDEEAEAD